MIPKLFLFLLVLGFASVILNDAHGQMISPQAHPFENKFVGIRFLDAYFGTLDEKLEVNPGDKNVPLTVVMSNVGSQDMIGIVGQLSVPFGFSDARNGGMMIEANSDTNALTGEVFSLTFFVDIDEGSKIMSYPATVKVDYSRLRESGSRSDTFGFDFDLTGRSVINMKALNHVLTSLEINKIVIEITNDGTSPISAVGVSVNNAVAESTDSQSVTNVEKVIVLHSNWDIGDIQPKSSKQLELEIMIPDSLKGETLRAPMELTYFNAHGDKMSTTRNVDFYVNGLIDISTNDIRAKKISEKTYIVGDIVNEGNEDGLFGYITIKPLNDSNLKSVTNFLDEIEVDSPIPFNIPIEFDGEPQYGNHDVEIIIRYKDTLRQEFFVTKQTTVFLEAPPVKNDSEISPMTFILPILGIGGTVFFLNKKGYIPLKKMKTTIANHKGDKK